MPSTWAGYRKAVKMRRHHMAEARECRDKGRETGDAVYWELVRVHVKTARAFNRNAWKGPAKSVPGKLP